MGSYPLDETRRAARLDEAERGMLSAPQQRDRLERRRALACLYPTYRSRRSVSASQERPGHEARLASERTPGAGPHPHLLSGLRALENLGPVVPTRRPRRRTTEDVSRLKGLLDQPALSGHSDQGLNRVFPGGRVTQIVSALWLLFDAAPYQKRPRPTILFRQLHQRPVVESFPLA